MLEENEGLFPARAGMNRCVFPPPYTGTTVPRTRGDEPEERMTDAIKKCCSPHARG